MHIPGEGPIVETSCEDVKPPLGLRRWAMVVIGKMGLARVAKGRASYICPVIDAMGRGIGI
jgi:hypothetical protein